MEELDLRFPLSPLYNQKHKKQAGKSRRVRRPETVMAGMRPFPVKGMRAQLLTDGRHSTNSSFCLPRASALDFQDNY